MPRNDRRRRPRTHVRQTAAVLILVSAAMLHTQNADYPAAAQISRSDLAIVLEDFAALPLPNSLTRRLSRVNMMRFEPGTTPQFLARTFVGDLKGTLYVLDLSTRQFSAYIDLRDVFARFADDGSYGSGFAAFVFDPGYQHNGRFYTVHTESALHTASAVPSNTNLPGLDLSAGYLTTEAIDPPLGEVVRHAVLVEWTDADLTNTAFEGRAREVLRVGFTNGNHTIADVLFNPTAQSGDQDYGNLYIPVGDGGDGQQSDGGHSMPQRLDAVLGKLLRITPDLDLRPADPLAVNGRYRIPTSGVDPNPFADLADPSVKMEIFAYGFRNPQRMSWDADTGSLIVADIGLHAWEEANIVRKGGNYGYAEREGREQLFIGGLNDGLTGSQTMPPSPFPDPDTLNVAGVVAPVVPVYPAAAYSHHDGDAIAGGFVYRGTRIPELFGKYVFGDITTARLFYSDLADLLAADDGVAGTLATVRELNVVFDDPADSPDLGPAAIRLFDMVADRFAARGGSTTDGAALPQAANHLSDGPDPDGVPFGGGRADIRFAQDRHGELYVLSKSDGMIRRIVGARRGGTTTVLTVSSSSSASGTPVQLDGSVTAAAGSPIGHVEFYDDGGLIGTQAVTNGSVSFTTSALAPGSNLLIARFVPGSPAFLGSASGTQHFVTAAGASAVNVTLDGNGAGTVTSVPAGIACPGFCIGSFSNGTTVTLTAVAERGSSFVGWTGVCSGAASCTVAVNAAATAIATFARGEPDLLSSINSIPATAAPGTALPLSETTRNAGTGTAGNSTTRYLLSLDMMRNAGDPTLGSRSVATLAAGATSPVNQSFTVPSATPTGNYYVIACADDTAKVTEISEANNCGVSATRVSVTRPDLVTTAVATPSASVSPGAKLTVTSTVSNSGGAPSVLSVTRHYLWLDGSKSTGDILLSGNSSVPALAPGSSATLATASTVPSGAALGMYFLLACADDTAKNNELSESNNCAAAPAQVRVGRADLVVSSVTNAPVEVVAGGAFPVTTVVANQGTAASTATKTRIYISSDTSRGGVDVLLIGTSAVVALAPGQSKSSSRKVTVPLSTAAGTYFVLACADDLAGTLELDEANNCAASATTIVVK